MAANSDANLRQRKLETETEPAASNQTAGLAKQRTAKAAADTESRWVEVARTLTLLFAISCGLSYLVSSGESFFWSMKVPPKYMRPEWWQSQIVRPFTVRFLSCPEPRTGC